MKIKVNSVIIKGIDSHIEYMDRGLFSEQKLSLPSTNQRDKNDELLINERFIREDEKEKIRFSKNGIICFINKISDEDLYDWITLYNQNGLEIYYQNGVHTKLILVNSFKFFFAR